MSMGILPTLVLLAQPPFPFPQAPKAPAIDSLAVAQPNLYWNVAARGALLLVAPEKYRLVTAPKPNPIDLFHGGIAGMMEQFGAVDDPKAIEAMRAAGIPVPAKPQPLPTAPRGGWNPAEIVPRFGCQLIRTGSITVVAPQVMAIHPKKKDGGDLTSEMMEMIQEAMSALGGTRLLPLIAGLTPSQLQQAVSQDGLLLSNLSADQQRRLLRPLLPRTLAFRFFEKPGFPDTPPPTAPVIPASDQAQFRLRLRRSINLAPNMSETGLNGAAGKVAVQLANVVPPVSAAGGVYELALRPSNRPNPLALLSALMGQSTEGTPARRKPSDLDTTSASLNVPIALTGAATVDDLVARIAQASKVNLVADKRIGKLTVSVRGASARAGDVLQALCWAVSGAVRRISDDQQVVYLLTEEVPVASNNMAELMGQMMQPMAGMMQNQKVAERDAVAARIRLIRQRVLPRVPRDPRTDLPDRLWNVAETLPDTRNGDFSLIPVGELPKEMQERAQAYHKAFAAGAAIVAGSGQKELPPLTSVRCTQSLVAELVAPTLGAVATVATTDANEIHPNLPIPMPPPPVPLPDAIKVRGALVPLPETDELAEKLVALASARGLTELRVPVPVGDAAEKAFARLAEKAKGKVGIVPVVCPLTPEKPTTPRDRSFSGLTLAEWTQLPQTTQLVGSLPPELRVVVGRNFSFDFAAPETADIDGFIARVKRLTALPGVSGLGMESVAAPGYRAAGPGPISSEGFFWEGGANPRERVAFVRQEHADPAELGGFNLGDIFGGVSSKAAWLKRTTARSDAFLTRLSTALTQAKLTAPLSIAVTGEPIRWEKWTGKYPTTTTVTSTVRPALRQLSYTRFLALAGMLEGAEFAGFEDAERFAGYLAKEVEKLTDRNAETYWDGLILDLSDQATPAALALLERVVAAR